MQSHLHPASSILITISLLTLVSCSGQEPASSSAIEPGADGVASSQVASEVGDDGPMVAAEAWVEAQANDDQAGIESMMTRRHRERVGAFIDFSYAHAGFQVEPGSQHISAEGDNASVKTIKAGEDWRNIFLRLEEGAWRVHLHDLSPSDNPPGDGAAEPFLIDEPPAGWTVETDAVIASPVWIGLRDLRTQTLRRAEPRARVRIEYLVFDNPEDARSAVWRVRAMALDATEPPVVSELEGIGDAIFVPRHERFPDEFYSSKLALSRGPVTVIAQGVPDSEAEELARALLARIQD